MRLLGRHHTFQADCPEIYIQVSYALFNLFISHALQFVHKRFKQSPMCPDKRIKLPVARFTGDEAALLEYLAKLPLS